MIGAALAEEKIIGTLMYNARIEAHVVVCNLWG